MKAIEKVLRWNIRPHLPGLFAVFLLTLFIIGLEALAPWPFKFLIDNVLNEESTAYLTIFQSRVTFGFFVVMAFFLINILLNLGDYLHDTLLKNVIRKIILEFSEIAFANIELLNIGYYRTQEIGDYIYRLNNDVSAIGSFIEDGVLPIVTSSLYVVVTTIVLFFISVKLTLLSLIALPFLAFGLYIFNNRIVLVSRKSEEWNSTVFTFVQEALTQLKIIQAFSQEKEESREFDNKIQSSLSTGFRLEKLNFLLSLIVGIIIATSYSFIIAYGINSVLAGEITTGLLVIFIFYLDNLTSPILSIIYAVSDMKENWVKIEHMGVFFNKKSQLENAGAIKEITHSNIEFKNIYLDGEEDAKILDDISLSIPEGKVTVIVGVSGSGKTSVVSLIPRLIKEPSRGKIFLGENPLNDYDIHTLRNSISLVPQENYLHNTSIYNIIAYGNPDCTEADVYEAARMADAHEFIEDLPGKYKFHVGEAGNYLSGGQRQRLMIARAFVKKAQIFIFDEPLSSLDIQTRSLVWKNIKKVCKDKTTIIISNVLDVITEADHVIMINKGKVVHAGKHSDLLKKSNLYKLVLHTE